MKRHCILLLLLFLTGCWKVGPNYFPPENMAGSEWNNPLEEGEYSEDDPQIAWWKVFDDPLLEKYIEIAARANKEILQAEAAICEARALRQVAASKLFPQISADLSALKTYFSKNGPIFAITPADVSGGALPSGSGPTATPGLPFSFQVPQIQNLFTALFDASWEIDLFGKTRRTVEMAEANVGSAIENRNDILISILAEIARNYVELRSFQKRSALTLRNIELLEQSAEIVRVQFAVGTASSLDVNQIEAALESARASLPDTHAEIYRNIYALSVLIGETPETLVGELIDARPLPTAPRHIAVGLRSDLLRRRPDVRRAERQLAAATAGVGVAIGAFFPTFTLFGDGGLQSLQIKKLFQTASRTWAYGGDFNLPIFQGGRLVGNLHIAEAERCMAGYQYQNTVLMALQDAEGSLISYSDGLASADLMRESAEHTREFARLSHSQFQAGLVSLLVSLQTARESVLADLNLLNTDTQALIALVALYKALGGGWQCEESGS